MRVYFIRLRAVISPVVFFLCGADNNVWHCKHGNFRRVKLKISPRAFYKVRSNIYIFIRLLFSTVVSSFSESTPNTPRDFIIYILIYFLS